MSGCSLEDVHEEREKKGGIYLMKKWISQILAWILVASSLYVSPVEAAEASVTQIPNTTRTIQQYDDSFFGCGRVWPGADTQP